MEIKKSINIKNIRECILWFTIWHSLLIIPAFGLFARSISVYFWLIYMALLLFYFISKKRTKMYLKKYYFIFVFLCTISLVSPIDIRFVPNWKDQKQFIVVLPIVSVHSGQWQLLQNMQADNKKAFKDYVPNIIHGTILSYPKYAIVIFYPSQHTPSEPIKLSAN
jgi:hypothetical protein